MEIMHNAVGYFIAHPLGSTEREKKKLKKLANQLNQGDFTDALIPAGVVINVIPTPNGKPPTIDGTPEESHE